MPQDKLKIHEGSAALDAPSMLVGFSGWMDGGRISTETIRYFIDQLDAGGLAEISAEGFFINSFPGSMEFTSIFRPHTKIENGDILELRMPQTYFYYSETHNLILMLAHEPHINWSRYADCVISLAKKFAVESIYFVGSVAGLVPHTRDPHIFCTASREDLKARLGNYNLKFSNYEGPASITTYLMVRCEREEIPMASLVAAVPAYVEGKNPRCLAYVAKTAAAILNIHVDMDELLQTADDFEKKLTEIVEEQPELAHNVRKLEEDYDKDLFNHEMKDLRNWLEQRGIKVD